MITRIIDQILVHILILSMAFACAGHPIRHDFIDRDGVQVEKEFIPHIELFEKHYKKTIRIRMVFSSLPFNVAGVCLGFPVLHKSMRSIAIDQQTWDRASEGKREEIILHELGHCILNRFHNNKKMDAVGTAPESIMFNTAFGDYYYYKMYREYYIAELFGKKLTPLQFYD